MTCRAYCVDHVCLVTKEYKQILNKLPLLLTQFYQGREVIKMFLKKINLRS